MALEVLIAGMAIGFAMAAPLGPVNLIVIRTALKHDLRGATWAGLGAVLADVLIASVAAYGLLPVQHFIEDYAIYLQVVGGMFLVILGVRTARTHFSASDLEPAPGAARLGLTFSLTLFNPATLLGFLAVFSSMSQILGLGASPQRPAQVLLAVALGGALWWIVLCGVMAGLKSKLSIRALDAINRWSGIFIAAFGFVLLMQIFD